jgi:hypothetical protein
MSLFKPLLLVIALGAATLPVVGASSVKVLKVLPQFIDLEGRCALSPSLYDRDAYQAYLRDHLEKRSGMRFAVEWKSSNSMPLKLRVELRGYRAGQPTSSRLEESVRHKGWFGSWAYPTIKGDDYKQLGDLTSWRATFWDGDTMVAEQKSFLW